METKSLDQLISVLKFVIVTVGFGYVSLSVNTAIQTREIEIKELEQVGKYVEMAVTENVATRKRFAEYFATVTRSEELKSLWKDYARQVNQEYEKEQQRQQAVESKVRNLEEELAKQKEVSERLEVETRLAQSLASLNTIKQELSVRPSYAQQSVQAARSGAGWVYLGEYDKEKRTWINVYYNIDRKQDPKDLPGKTLKVTSQAVNVREKMPSAFGAFGNVVGNLKNGTEVTVTRIQEWQSSGYMWAAVSY